MPGLNDFRHRMHVLTCFAINRTFSLRNSKKRQNLAKTQTVWHGALNWSYKAMKKRAHLRMSTNKVLPNRSLWPIRTLFIEHGIYLEISGLPPTFASKWACLMLGIHVWFE